MHSAFRLAHRAFDLRMAEMADHHNLASRGAQFCHFDMHFGHQWTRSVEYPQPALLRIVAAPLSHAMRGEHDDAPVGT